MQPEMVPVQLFQLSPQLATIQCQLRTAIANHQRVFGNYQKDPKNAVLRDKLQEMQVQIRNLSNHQTVIVEQLRGQLIQTAASNSGASSVNSSVTAATTGPSSTTSCVPVIVTPSCVTAVTKPAGTTAPRPQLLTLPQGIVVPIAHVQAQPTLVTLPGVLSQPSLQTPQPQPLVSVQLNPSTAPSPAILTPPTPLSAVPVSTTVAKATAVSVAVTSAASKPNPSVLRPIQPRPASPPIKVPHYTANNHHSAQGQQSGTHKGAEKTNGLIHRSFSESDAKELKKSVNQSEKDVNKVVDDKDFIAEKKKLEFLKCIGLVTHDASKAIQNKRVERKRRSTANPHYCYTLDSQRRRNGNYSNSNGSSWLMGGLPAKRPRARPVKPIASPANSCPASPDSQAVSPLDGGLSENKGELCAECGKEGQLLLCGTCSLTYHLDCLSPPLSTVPEFPWSCPACIVSGKGNSMLSSAALSMVNSYITTKANKEDEKRKAQRKNVDLLQEKQNLMERKTTLEQQTQEEQKKKEKLETSLNEKTVQLEALKAFVKTFQDPSPPVTST